MEESSSTTSSLKRVGKLGAGAYGHILQYGKYAIKICIEESNFDTSMVREIATSRHVGGSACGVVPIEHAIHTTEDAIWPTMPIARDSLYNILLKCSTRKRLSPMDIPLAKSWAY